jgi:hypothetical protein
MSLSYKTVVVGTKGLRIKGDDTSAELASFIEEESIKMSHQGWKLIAVTPSLMSEGALIKVLLTFEK